MRWELCKVWKCSVDDPIFAGISAPQWSWYAHMILKDKKTENEKYINLVEYLASFWNYEAVKSIQDARHADDMHTFTSDEEFDEQIKSGIYKDNEYLDAVKAIKENTNFSNNNERNVNRDPSERFRTPRSLSALRKMIEDNE